MTVVHLTHTPELNQDLAFGYLTKRMHRVHVMRGLGFTFREIGEHFGVNKERARQLHGKAERYRKRWSKYTDLNTDLEVMRPKPWSEAAIARELVAALGAIQEKGIEIGLRRSHIDQRSSD